MGAWGCGEAGTLFQHSSFFYGCFGGGASLSGLPLQPLLIVLAADFHHLQRFVRCLLRRLGAVGLRTACCGHEPTGSS
ncbi:MAG: hypothetical protein WBH13_08135, partial [Parasynechococcus sp.]